MFPVEAFPNLVDFMSKCLYQFAAPTFDEAIRTWSLTGEDSIRAVRSELDAILSAGYSEDELATFVWKYCDYIEGEGATSTLNHVRKVMQDM